MVNEAVEKRLTVNNEYYVATSMNLLIENGKRIKAFFADSGFHSVIHLNCKYTITGKITFGSVMRKGNVKKVRQRKII